MPALNQTSVATFSDAEGWSLRYADEIEPAWDEAYLENHVQVNGPEAAGRTGSGVAIDASAADPNTGYGRIVKMIDTQLVEGGDRQALAEYRVRRYAQPLMRLAELELRPTSRPSYAWPIVLALEIGDPITFVRYAGTIAELRLELTIEGMHATGRPGAPMNIALRTSPRDARTAFQVGHATLGKVGAAFGNQVPGISS